MILAAMTYKSSINTESTSTIINTISDVLLSRLDEQECITFTRNESSADELLAAFDEHVICMRQAILMLRESADDESSQTAIRDCGVPVGVAWVRMMYALGSL
jgi:hypothetical protein